MKYKASFDFLTLTITSLVIILFTGIIIVNVHAYFNADTSSHKHIHGFVLLLFPLVIISCYAFSIKGYMIEGSDLIILRPIGSRKISIPDIAEVRAIKREEMTAAIRTFGVGGLFGYYGKYYSWTLGSLTLYTTQRKNRVLIILKNGKKILISPDDLSLVERLSAS